MPKRFAIIGAGGYIAPRHMKAIRDTGNIIAAALDPSDSVGILDSYSFDIPFFTEFERFDRHLEKLRRLGPEQRIDYVSICSPNYLHDAHIRFALRIGADAICEKPLVLNPWNVDALLEIERESGRKVYTVLQLRTHPAIIALKERVASADRGDRYDIDLTYITSRGRWYFNSWKGDIQKSGGVATNIGIHFFDMLIWVFGQVLHQEVHYADNRKMAGALELEKATVRWFLSLDRDDVPEPARSEGKYTYRSLVMNGEEIEFSEGFTDLHTIVYRDILENRGYGMVDARPSIVLAHELRKTAPVQSDGPRQHPFVAKLKRQ